MVCGRTASQKLTQLNVAVSTSRIATSSNCDMAFTAARCWAGPRSGRGRRRQSLDQRDQPTSVDTILQHSLQTFSQEFSNLRLTRQIAVRQSLELLSRKGFDLLPSLRSSIATTDPEEGDQRVLLCVVHAFDL
jgi:hypothetical protein